MNCLGCGTLAFILILLTTWNTSLAQSASDPASSATVLLSLTVTDNRKQLISGLPQSAFTVSDDKGTREITSFSSEDVPTSIAILFDTSGSIKLDGGSKVRSIVEALSHFVRRSHQSNEYFVIGFNDQPHLLLDRTRDSSAVSSLLQQLTFAHSRGNTALFDACIFAINKVTSGTYPKQVILLLSDGKDNVSKSTLNHVLRLLQEKNVLVYAMDITLVLGEYTGTDSFNTEGSEVLAELTSITGGVNYRPDNAKEINTDLERIGLELRHQYSVGISSAKEASGSKWHPLKVKVSLPSTSSHDVQKLSVRSRKGYYSAASKK